MAPPKGYFHPEHVLVTSLDYAGWDLLLEQYVRDGWVDYPAFARSPEFRAVLDRIRRARLLRETPRAVRLAFLVNAYNARAIAAVVGGGSPASLLGRYGFFWRTRHPVGGEEITLWDLEHERIRPLGEPRIHFALVCASRSCPALASHAYRPDRLDAQLEQAARAFVNDPERNRFDAERRVARISPIFEWYEEDFLAVEDSVAAYVARYVDDPAVTEGLAAGAWTVRYTDYDWSLNGTPPPGG